MARLSIQWTVLCIALLEARAGLAHRASLLYDQFPVIDRATGLLIGGAPVPPTRPASHCECIYVRHKGEGHVCGTADSCVKGILDNRSVHPSVLKRATGSSVWEHIALLTDVIEQSLSGTIKIGKDCWVVSAAAATEESSGTFIGMLSGVGQEKHVFVPSVAHGTFETGAFVAARVSEEGLWFLRAWWAAGLDTERELGQCLLCEARFALYKALQLGSLHRHLVWPRPKVATNIDEAELRKQTREVSFVTADIFHYEKVKGCTRLDLEETLTVQPSFLPPWRANIFPVFCTAPFVARRNRKLWFKALAKKEKLNVGIEIGVREGGHSAALLASGNFKEFHMVDPWEHQASYVDASNSKHSQNMVDAKNRVAAFKDIVHLVKAYSQDVHGRWANESVDFIYIDARHDYPSVRQDMDLYWPKLKPGAVMSGHDFLNCDNLKTEWGDWCVGPNGESYHPDAVRAAVLDFARSYSLQATQTFSDTLPTWALRKPQPRDEICTYSLEPPSSINSAIRILIQERFTKILNICLKKSQCLLPAYSNATNVLQIPESGMWEAIIYQATVTEPKVLQSLWEKVITNGVLAIVVYSRFESIDNFPLRSWVCKRDVITTNGFGFVCLIRK